MYNSYKKPEIIRVVKAGTILWLGELLRSEDIINCCTKLTFTQPK
jgi:hypothetical protein